MLELSNRPRVIKVVTRDGGVAKNVAQIRKDTLEIQGELDASVSAANRAELDTILKLLRQSQAMHREAVLVRLAEVLSEATQFCMETSDDKQRQLIRSLIEGALRQVRKSERG